MLTSLDLSALWVQIASVAAWVALYAQRQAQPRIDPVEALIFRLRHPVASAIRTPLATLRRTLDRRTRPSVD